MNFEDVSLSDAQRVLVRHMRGVLPDDANCAAVVLASLDSARIDALPTEPIELIDFTREHLVPALKKEIGPKLAFALLNDVTVEIREMGEASSRGPNIKTPLVVIPVRPPPKDASGVNGAVKVSFPKLRRSVASLVRTASMRIRAAISSAKTSPSGDHLPVLLVHPDRLVRASIARALVNARFDVTGFDSTPQLIPTLRSRKGACIVVLDIWEKGVEATLRSVAMANPDVRILAWTDMDKSAGESLLRASGAKRFAVLSRTAAEIELVDAARKLTPS